MQPQIHAVKSATAKPRPAKTRPAKGRSRLGKAKSDLINLQSDALLEITDLRKVAENRLSASQAVKGGEKTEGILHELRVHQIELEIQNEELRLAQVALEQSLDRYVSLYEFAPVGYLTITEDGSIVEANLTSAVSLGEARSNLLKQHFSHFISPEDADRWHQHFSQVKQQSKGKSCEIKMQRADGTIFYAHLDCLVLESIKLSESDHLSKDEELLESQKRLLSSHEQSMVRVALTDITETKMAEQELHVAATVFESHEGMMITDAHHKILKVNRAFTAVTGYFSEDVVGGTPKKLQSGRHDEVFYEEMWSRIQATGAWQGEVWDRKKNDDVFPAWLTITAVKNPRDEVTHYVATIVDISARKAAEDEMQLLAFYDPLTKLPNRRLMLDRLHRAIPASARTRRHCALMFIDLDKFKEMNDSLGHDIGDMLLQLVAQRLSICVREGDTVARMGGDEFMVMLENLSEIRSEAEMMAEVIGRKILSAMHQPFRLGVHECESSASIGVTLFIDHRYTIPELQKQADLAMYEAKLDGRNQLRFFRPEMKIQNEAKNLSLQ